MSGEIVVMLALTAFPSLHHRARQPPHAALHRAQAAAVRYWGRDPCGGAIRVVRSPATAEPAAFAEANRPGYVLWAWAQYTVTPTGPADCSVHLVAGIWNRYTEAWDYREFCPLMVHEYGHLLGYVHNADPASIMYPTINRANERLAVCHA